MAASRKKTLVSGGAGFLGSHLCRRLLNEGHTVICVDNFSTGSRKNVLPFLEHPFFQLMVHDICLPFHLEVDEIYNLASPASPVHYQSDPVQTVKTNVQGMLTMLELARNCGAKLLQASTSEVYGDPDLHPQPEEYWGSVNPIGPRSCYDEGKRCAETLCFDYFRQYGLPLKLARIFNTYGPQMQIEDGRVVSNFIVQALEGKGITLYGKGEQTRSFCFVDDLIEALIRLMKSDGEVVGPINLGNPTECSIIELATLILRLTRSPSPLIFKPLPSDDPRRRCPDITRARQLLMWEPHIPLEEGLKKTIEYFTHELELS